MSSPGYFMAQQAADPNQMTPQQKMAMALMGGNKTYNPQQQYAGLADAGSSLAGAMAMKNMADNQKWSAQGVAPVQVTPQQVGGGVGAWAQRNLGSLFSVGGGS